MYEFALNGQTGKIAGTPRLIQLNLLFSAVQSAFVQHFLHFFVLLISVINQELYYVKIYISRISIIFIAIILSLSCMIMPASAASVNKHISNSDDISKTKISPTVRSMTKRTFTDDGLNN